MPAVLHSAGVYSKASPLTEAASQPSRAQASRQMRQKVHLPGSYTSRKRSPNVLGASSEAPSEALSATGRV
jgi:hypothetical protein